LGNVWEWVWDWGAEYVKSAQVDPVGPGAGSFRVGRGGSWFYVARLARAAFRGSSDPSHRINRLGFRPARSLTK
jgi:formylglycine-generating enzyme required for sulfatase activity